MKKLQTRIHQDLERSSQGSLLSHRSECSSKQGRDDLEFSSHQSRQRNISFRRELNTNDSSKSILTFRDTLDPHRRNTIAKHTSHSKNGSLCSKKDGSDTRCALEEQKKHSTSARLDHIELCCWMWYSKEAAKQLLEAWVKDELIINDSPRKNGTKNSRNKSISWISILTISMVYNFILKKIITGKVILLLVILWFYCSIIKLSFQWLYFIMGDPKILDAFKKLRRQHKLLRKELQKTLDGGFFRRRQEFATIIASTFVASSFYRFLAAQNEDIRREAIEASNRTISLYHDALPR
jgi:hypothetical protein